MPPTYANGHISATVDPIHFMFGSRVGFSGTADQMTLFTVWRNVGSRVGFSGTADQMTLFTVWRNGGHRHVGKISSGDISANGRPIHFMFCSRAGFSGTADLTALFPVLTNPRWRPSPSWKNFKWRYRSSATGHRSTSCLVIGWGFRRRQI